MSPSKVSTTFEINNFALRTLLGMVPMTRTPSVKDSIPRQDVLYFLLRRADNGAALVTTEAIVSDSESAQAYPTPAKDVC